MASRHRSYGRSGGAPSSAQVACRRFTKASAAPVAGPHVSEMIAESQLIVGWNAEPADVARHVHAHPTLSEAVGEVFLTLAGRGLHQQ